MKLTHFGLMESTYVDLNALRQFGIENITSKYQQHSQRFSELYQLIMNNFLC